MNLPVLFKENIQALLENEADTFFQSIELEPTISIRLNPNKISSFDALQKNSEVDLNFTQIPWAKYGYYLDHKIESSLNPLWHAGSYYVQEASSMIISQLIDFSKDIKVLDLCAAPGGKSTLVSSLLTPKSLLVSNDVVPKRLRVLIENLNKWGRSNNMVTINQPKDFAVLNEVFDVVLVDAPCTGEGLVRKNPYVLNAWSEKTVEGCQKRQIEILSQIAGSVKISGRLIYSTCTFNIEENEEVVGWFLENFPEFKLKHIELEQSWGLTSFVPGTYRCLPHKFKGEGLFFAVLEKVESGSIISFEKAKKYGKKELPKFKPLSKKELDTVAKFIDPSSSKLTYLLRSNQVYAFTDQTLEFYDKYKDDLHFLSSGIFLGVFKNEDFLPSHNLALSDLINPSLDGIDVDYTSSVLYLQGKDFPLTSAQQQLSNWLLVRYEGLNLGWVKKTFSKVNNCYPKEFRIGEKRNS
jgi:16S rRNA (cytosine1407-C5)-methyltransferase